MNWFAVALDVVVSAIVLVVVYGFAAAWFRLRRRRDELDQIYARRRVRVLAEREARERRNRLHIIRPGRDELEEFIEYLDERCPGCGWAVADCNCVRKASS